MCDDWYYQHTWFERKWFKHKLKRFIMNVLLDIWRKIGNKILFEYYTEIDVYDTYSLYCLSFPLIIKDENPNHATNVINKICRDLEKDFGFGMVCFRTLEPISNKEYVSKKIENFYLGVEPKMVGEIEFNVYHGKNIKPKNIELITNDRNIIDELGTYKFIDSQTISYKTINQLDNYLPPLEKFLVKIFLIDNQPQITNLTKEEELDRMKFLNSYKPKK